MGDFTNDRNDQNSNNSVIIIDSLVNDSQGPVARKVDNFI